MQRDAEGQPTIADDAGLGVRLKPVPQAEEKIQNALLAQYAGHHDEALKLLRESKTSKPFSRISYLRGQNWEGKDEPRVALLFFKHALQLEPDNDEYRAAVLSSQHDALSRVG